MQCKMKCRETFIFIAEVQPTLCKGSAFYFGKELAANIFCKLRLNGKKVEACCNKFAALRVIHFKGRHCVPLIQCP